MIEALADESTRGDEHAWLLGIEPIEVCDQRRPGLLRHAAVKREDCGDRAIEAVDDRFKMIAALGKHKNLASSFVRLDNLFDDGRGSSWILGQVLEDILDPLFGRQPECVVPPSRKHLQIFGR